jgi:putative ABC transport system permease protein
LVLRLETLWFDVKITSRTLARSPGFTTIAILTLALGIGATTTVFSVVNAVLIRPLPYENPDSLVIIHEINPSFGSNPIHVPSGDVATFQRETHTFELVAAFRTTEMDLASGGISERIRAARVSWTIFPLLGITPALGRAFAPEEDEPAPTAAILSYGLWQRRFGSKAATVGSTIVLDRRVYTVIGVMPKRFTFPTQGLSGMESPELWVPVGFTAQDLATTGDYFQYGVVARLKAGVSLARAQSVAETLAQRIQQGYSPEQREMKIGVVITPLRDAVIGHVATTILFIFAAAGLVLLIACVNIVHLLLVRVMRRQGEIGLRFAFGMRGVHLLRQLVIENVLLVGSGGLLGLLAAYFCNELLVVSSSLDVPRFAESSIDAHVALFTVGLSLFIAFAVSLVPLWAARDIKVVEILKEGGRNAVGGRGAKTLRRILVISETALAFGLAAAAGLLIHSFVLVRSTDPGFRFQQVIGFSIALPRLEYSQPEQRRSFYRELENRIANLSGVKSVGLATDLPFVIYPERRMFTPETHSTWDRVELTFCSNSVVSDNYFRTLGIPLLKGRYFTPADNRGSMPVVIVSESIVKRLWPNHDPIGRRLKWGRAESDAPWLTIVGVVGDVKQGALDVTAMPHIYGPYEQVPDPGLLGMPSVVVVARTEGDPVRLVPALRAEIGKLDPLLAIGHLHSMSEAIDASLFQRRFNLILLLAFALLALVLASTGLYGIMSHGVISRQHEIGTRIAVGATRINILAMIVREGVKLVCIGLGTGTVFVLALTRVMHSMLYGVRTLDPLAFGAAGVVLLGSALAATSIPALRAMRIDPGRLLRST